MGWEAALLLLFLAGIVVGVVAWLVSTLAKGNIFNRHGNYRLSRNAEAVAALGGCIACLSLLTWFVARMVIGAMSDSGGGGGSGALERPIHPPPFRR